MPQVSMHEYSPEAAAVASLVQAHPQEVGGAFNNWFQEKELPAQLGLDAAEKSLADALVKFGAPEINTESVRAYMSELNNWWDEMHRPRGSAFDLINTQSGRGR